MPVRLINDAGPGCAVERIRIRVGPDQPIPLCTLVRRKNVQRFDLNNGSRQRLLVLEYWGCASLLADWDVVGWDNSEEPQAITPLVTASRSASVTIPICSLVSSGNIGSDMNSCAVCSEIGKSPLE